MIRIGIIEDDKSVIPAIKLVIAEYAGNSEKIDYKEYPITDGKNVQKEILDNVFYDIEAEEIQTLIVDFKLNTKNLAVRGSDIIRTIRDQLSEFPMIILTNVVEDGKNSTATDADKVYPKEVFLDPEDSRTEEMVKNIILNIKRYKQLRDELELQRMKILSQMQGTEEPSQDEKIEMMKQLILVETELQKFTPTHLMSIEKVFPVQQYKEVLDILHQYKELLDADGETDI